MSSGRHVSAQVSTANVTGIVEDSTGARLADASVKLINGQTGSENNSKSNSVGIFLLPGVIPGNYSLQIEREGFATAQFTGLVLNVGDTKSFVIRMKVGDVAETVSIDASSITTNSVDAAVSTVVDQKFVANIPLNGRSFQDLISMTPGVSTQTPQAFGASYSAQGDFSVNGQQPDTNSYTVDGVSADIGVGQLGGHTKYASSGNAAGTTALGTTQSLVSLDALQEFRALTSNYSAEYGRTSGGQFTLLTRSGTSTLHGTVYDYVRYFNADAADWFANFHAMFPSPSYRHPYRQSDIGGTIGGPVSIHALHSEDSKTFFFVSTEKLRVTEPTAPLVRCVPLYSLIEQAPVPLQNVLSALWTLGGGLSTDPPPVETGLTCGIGESISNPGSVSSTNARIDHSFSSRLSGFARTSFTPSDSFMGSPAFRMRNHVNTQTYLLGTTFQISPKVTNDFRSGYGFSTSLFNAGLSDYVPLNLTYGWHLVNFNDALGIPSSSFPSASADVFLHSAGAGESEVMTDQVFGSVHQWNIRDTFATQAGHHLLQFGFDQRHLASYIHPPTLNVTVDFFDIQSVLANSASNIAITRSLPAAPVFNQFAAFLQDGWQVSKSLMITGGLRWELSPAPHGKNGVDAFTALGNVTSPGSMTLAPRGTLLWNTNWFNLAPRLGAAWVVDNRAGQELVIRAGAGIFFDTNSRAAVRAFSALGFSQTMHSTKVPVPVTANQLDFSVSSTPPYTNSLVFAFPRNLQLPYSVQWNFAMEKALGQNQTFTTSYVGASGQRLLREQRTDINSQNSSFGEIAWFPLGVTSNYQALQLKFQRSMARGIQALGAYTWAHSIDWGSVDPAWSLTRANSNLDLRHKFEAAVSWDQQKVLGRGSGSLLWSGWGADIRITARSAFPVTPIGNIYSDPATGNRYFSGVDQIPNRPLYVYGSGYPGGRMLNGGPNAVNPAFVLPAIGNSGNMPRNMMRGFGSNQFNVAVRREIRLHDSMGLQLRAEAYNLINHPDLGYVEPSLTDALFGQATLMLNQSFGPAGSLYAPGGPRSLQVSVRFHF
jgi:hypothetical protein